MKDARKIKNMPTTTSGDSREENEAVLRKKQCKQVLEKYRCRSCEGAAYINCVRVQGLSSIWAPMWRPFLHQQNNNIINIINIKHPLRGVFN